VAELRVVAVLGLGVVAAQTPILRADDLGTIRGDGIFETMHVRGGRAWLIDQHLARMSISAARLDLILPAPDQLVALVEEAVAAWPVDEEGTLRLVCTRGREDSATPTVFASISAVPGSLRATRSAGVRVLTASLGFAADLRQRAPWLLGGAKTLSYAVNMASLRWAQANGADDVLWLSGDGYVLEAPTSTLVWLDGTTLWSIPVEQTGILAGTTAAFLLSRAGELGWTTAERLISPAELRQADGAWLTSSVRGATPIRAVDGQPLRQAEQADARIRELLGFALFV
jgi:4-amino-4-deoxychorismate lyase